VVFGEPEGPKPLSTHLLDQHSPQGTNQTHKTDRVVQQLWNSHRSQKA
jgi:hypothetical protein